MVMTVEQLPEDDPVVPKHEAIFLKYIYFSDVKTF
jgi:hypothetical protein